MNDLVRRCRQIVWPFVTALAMAVVGSAQAGEPIQSNRYYSVKGGVGIVETDLYVVVRSASNELIVGRARWRGQPRATPQVVYVMDGKVIEDPSRTPGFDLARCVLISFQPDRVYLHLFAKGEGGYYLRQDL